jgi:hypothetical protein
MAFAAANQVSLRLSEETVWGETPVTPAMTEVRFTGETLNHVKDTVESNTIRSDRMRDDILEVGVGAEGDINFELSYGDFDAFIEGVMNSDWAAVTTGVASIAVDSVAKTFTKAAGTSFITLGFKVGMWVKASGFVATGDDKYFYVTTVTATVLTVEDPDGTLVTEAGTGDETISTDFIRNGVTAKSYLIEKAFTDIGKFIYYNGCRVNHMQLSVTSKEIVTGSFAFLGKQGVSGNATVSSGVTPASVKTPLTGSVNVGSFYKNGVALTSAIRALTIQAANNLRPIDAIGTKSHREINTGFFEPTGTIEFFLDDLAMYDVMQNHTAIRLSFRLTDKSGNILIFTIPKVYLSKSTTQATGPNTEVMVNCDWKGVRDDTGLYSLQVNRFAAP